MSYKKRYPLPFKLPIVLGMGLNDAAYRGVYSSVSELVDAHLIRACPSLDVGYKVPPFRRVAATELSRSAEAL
jgi:hypothetical protein